MSRYGRNCIIITICKTIRHAAIKDLLAAEGEKMEPNMDSVKFESRREIKDIMEAITKYEKAYPNEDNPTLKRLHDVLEGLYIGW